MATGTRRTRRAPVHNVPVAAPTSAAPLQIADGTLEALKLIALALMLLDHIDKWVLGRQVPYAYELSRVVAPVFAFVLAYNLARPDAFQRGVHLRVIRRLGAFGAIAAVPFYFLVGSWWPQNILFTLMVGVFLVYCIEKNSIAWGLIGGAVFLFSGGIVEFFFPALMMFVAAWGYCRQPGAFTFVMWIALVAALQIINGNAFALLCVPLVLAARSVQIKLPRWPWLFYVAYPVHLLGIALVVAR